MKKRCFILCLVIVTVSIVFNSCRKDDKGEIIPKKPINGISTAEFNPKVAYGTMTDCEGNIYKTVTIGTQTWMAENLRTTLYSDGAAIRNVTDDAEWEALTAGAYCNYNNTISTDTIATYGRLYNWYAVNTGKLSPTGWHVPTDAEWTTLIKYLGDMDVAGDKLKEASRTHWPNFYSDMINEFGFTALPGGFCTNIGTFDSIGDQGHWWSATEVNINIAWSQDISNFWSDIFKESTSKKVGISVRCVKD